MQYGGPRFNLIITDLTTPENYFIIFEKCPADENGYLILDD